MLSFEEDPEPYGMGRDKTIRALAREAKVDVVVRTSHTLYPLQESVFVRVCVCLWCGDFFASREAR